jgi:Transposase DDE domain/Transposase domain (DUF772)
MQIASTKPLFAWDCLEDSPTLTTIRDALAVVPDARLLESLRTWRGRGRDDYPVAVLWAVHLLTVLLRHPSTEATLAELRRNPSLRRLIGIESERGVPKKWNISRFEKVLGAEPHRSLVHEIFNTMIRLLTAKVDDLGKDLAGDATNLLGRRLRSKTDDGDLPGPTGGRKEYTDEAGNVTHVVEWFGYKLHLLVDVRHEVAVGYRISSANVGDCVMLPEVLKDALGNLPKNRIKTLAYDKAADDNKTHEVLDAEHISPLIRNRCLWKDDFERMLPGHDGTSNVVYDEAGTLYCYDKRSNPPVRRRMAYIGHEPARGTLKYRCPAMHAGWRCSSHRRCNDGLKYGKTVRVKREIDLRRFPPIPRATKKFERLYKGRTAVERVNARLKIFWGVDDGNVTGPARFHARVGSVMIIHAALATLLASCPRREGTLGQTRLSPIAKALRKELRL